jgi:hypothetical protein
MENIAKHNLPQDWPLHVSKFLGRMRKYFLEKWKPFCFQYFALLWTMLDPPENDHQKQSKFISGIGFNSG